MVAVEYLWPRSRCAQKKQYDDLLPDLEERYCGSFSSFFCGDNLELGDPLEGRGGVRMRRDRSIVRQKDRYVVQEHYA